MSKKWTKWIPHTGGECPVKSRETVKIRNNNGWQSKRLAGERSWSQEGPYGISHYKRLKKNVEAERAADLKWTDEQIAEMEGSGESAAPLEPNRLPPLKASMNQEMSQADKDRQKREAIEATEKLLALSPDGEIRDDFEANVEAEAPVEACLRVIETLYELVPPEEVALELDKLKAELQRHLNTAENKASDPEQTVSGATPSEQPEAIITGPGEYVTRCKAKAVVKSTCKGGEAAWVGFIVEHTDETRWGASGAHPHRVEYDIVGPWEGVDEVRDVIIPKVGEYRTSFGQKAVIDKIGCNTPWPVVGSVGGVRTNWNQWGDGIWSLYDIIGPWIDEPETPAPIITGPGEYVTRDGRKAVVDLVDENSKWPFVGKVGVHDSSWCGDGRYWKHTETDIDITGPWVEPEPKTEKTEVWRRLLVTRGGNYTLGVQVHSSKEKCIGTTDDFDVGEFFGAVLLSHTVEEGE